jgi:hypothetical protein
VTINRLRDSSDVTGLAGLALRPPAEEHNFPILICRAPAALSAIRHLFATYLYMDEPKK